jgi:hypothetical protein
MRQARKRALDGVHDIVTQTPTGVGLLLCGRDHYFDSIVELRDATGIGERPFSIVKIGEFTEGQAKEFLKTNGITIPLPDWLPRKPLLLGYLATHGLLEDVLQVDGSLGFSCAWKEFLRLICDREALYGHGIMNANVIHNILLRIACDVRSTVSGTGPITAPSLVEAYQLETGRMPVEGDLMQLQRLPGLTERDQGPATRSFIDEDMLAALQGESIANAILGDLKILGTKSWLDGMSPKSICMAAYLLKEQGTDAATVISSSKRFVKENSSVGIER